MPVWRTIAVQTPVVTAGWPITSAPLAHLYSATGSPAARVGCAAARCGTANDSERFGANVVEEVTAAAAVPTVVAVVVVVATLEVGAATVVDDAGTVGAGVEATTAAVVVVAATVVEVVVVVGVTTGAGAPVGTTGRQRSLPSSTRAKNGGGDCGAPEGMALPTVIMRTGC